MNDNGANTNAPSEQEQLTLLLQRVQRLEEEQRKQKKRKRDDGDHNDEEAAPDDVITINAGGKIIQALRGTLCLVEGSTLAHMFTERWQNSHARDEQGRIFLDHDSEMMESIVEYLRVKKIQDPQRKLKPPSFSDIERQDRFLCLLQYFGLKEYFYPWTPLPENFQPVPASSSSVTTSRDQGKHRFHYSDEEVGPGFLALSPALAGQNIYYWKCTIVNLEDQACVFIGLIGRQKPRRDGLCFRSYNDSTSFGWTHCAYVAGKNQRRHAWAGFKHGEVLYFRLQDQVLTMYSTLKNRSFTIPNIPNGPHIHFDFASNNTVVELEPLSISEKSEAGW
mmetsp:Transcript_28967/g.79465  ORF Transcript_28967/g.79465 Transcript_28967/m.79465 type:complete len:335 (+) Transcript_28967:46-1050(+)